MTSKVSLSDAGSVLWTWAATFLPRIAAAIAIFIIGMLLAAWVARGAQRILAAARHLDPALKPVIVAIIRYTILGFTFLATLEQLGFQTTSLLAVLGAAGLAIGLALQGTLSNIAAGLMLLWLRPFQIGDYIEVAAQSGAVEEIGLFACRLRTFDGLFLFLPNSSIWNTPLRNHTRNGGRLICIDLHFPPATEISSVRERLVTKIRTFDGVLAERPARVFVEGLGPTGLIVSVTFWSEPQRAGEVERRAIEELIENFQAESAPSRPTQITRTVPPDADPSRFLERRTPLAMWNI